MAAARPSNARDSGPTVFINYRREDTQWVASFLYDKLAPRLGTDHVFMDIDSIPFGQDWEIELRNKVGACDAMLVLIGEKWLTPRQKRRLASPEDHLRQEIEAALAREQVRVVPILVDGARLPRSQDLPDSLQPLLRCQAHDIPRAYFAEGVDRLVEALIKAYTPETSEFEASIKRPLDIEPSRGQTVAELYTSAMVSMEANNLLAARDLLTRVVKLEPEHAEALTKLQQVEADLASRERSQQQSLKSGLSVPARIGLGAISVVVLIAVTLVLLSLLFSNVATAGGLQLTQPATADTGLVLGSARNPVVHSPTSGSLVQRPNFIEESLSAGSLTNFEAAVTFTNPTGASWDYGFLFRETSGRNHDYRLYIKSTGHWLLTYGVNGPNLAHGRATAFATSPGASNTLLLIVGGKLGTFVVNGRFAGGFSNLRKQVKGTLTVGSGFLATDITSGRTVNYSNFTVWSATATYDATRGTPIHLKSGQPYTWNAFDSLRDAIATVTLHAPSQNKWDYGFFFRASKPNRQYVILINSRRRLLCLLDQGLSNGTIRLRRLCDETNLLINTGAGASNTLLLYFLTNRAILFLNRSLAASWDISTRQTPGNVIVVSNDLSEDKGSPPASFQNFYIWSLDS